MRASSSFLIALLLGGAAASTLPGCIGNRRPQPRTDEADQAEPAAAPEAEPEAAAPADAKPAAADAEPEADAEQPESLGHGEPSLKTNYGIPAADRPARGPDDALVTIVEYGGLTCEQCKKNVATMKALLEKHDDVRWVFRHLPTEEMVDKGAARAGAAVGRREAFWKLREAVTAHEGNFSGQTFYDMVEKIGLDVDQFKTDLRAPETAEILTTDKAIVDVFRGTQEPPFFFVNGRFVLGTTGPDQLERIIAEERAKAKAFAQEHQVTDRTKLYEQMRVTWRGADLADRAAENPRRKP